MTSTKISIANLFLSLVLIVLSTGLNAQDQSELGAQIDSLHILSQQYPDSSLEIINPLLKQARQNKWKKEEGLLLATKAIAFDLLGKYDSAYLNNNKAREIFELLSDQKGLSLVHNNLGILAFSRSEYDKALDYFNASLKADLALKDSSGVAGTLVNIGIITSYLELPDSSLSCYFRAADLYRQLGNPIGEALANSNRAKILVSQGDVREAESIYLNVIETLTIHNASKESIVTAHNSLATVYATLGKLDLAEQHSRKSIAIAREHRLPERLMYCYETLSDILSKKGQDDEALDSYKLFIHTKDSLYTKERDALVADIESQYELEKKEKELALSKLDVEKVELEKEKKTSQRNLWIGFSAVSILLSFFILQRYRSRTTESRLLEERNKLNARLIEQQSTLLSETHHRIKNNLQVISSMLSMQIDHVTDPQAQSALQSCVDRVSNIALLHEKLQVGEEQEGIKLEEYLNDLVGTLASASGRENGRINLDIEDVKFPIEVALPIGLIINELVTNSLKHAEPVDGEMHINISLKSSGNHYNLTVKDNGSISHEELSSRLDQSFGWQIVKSFSRQIKASYEIKDSPGVEISILFSIKTPEA